MSWIGRLFGTKRLDNELDAELRFHIDRLADDLMASGMPPEEAHREAALRFGGEAQVAEECRDARGTARVESIIQDLKYAVRVLAKTPTVTATAIFATALAIGANTIIFSGVHALLLKPLPYPGEDRLFMLFGKIPGENASHSLRASFVATFHAESADPGAATGATHQRERRLNESRCHAAM